MVIPPLLLERYLIVIVQENQLYPLESSGMMPANTLENCCNNIENRTREPPDPYGSTPLYDVLIGVMSSTEKKNVVVNMTGSDK